MKRLSDIQRMEVVDRDGKHLGHVFDVVTEAERNGDPPRLVGLLIGRGGLARRLGIRRGSARRVAIDDVDSIRGKKIVATGESGE